MIRYSVDHRKREQSIDKGIISPKLSIMEQLFFSDDPNLENFQDRFIGQGTSSEINQSLEEAFLSVAYLINAPTVVSEISAIVKNPSDRFENIAFDLIQVSAKNGQILITGDSIVLHVSINGDNTHKKNNVYYDTWTFQSILLEKGDLIAIRVQPNSSSMSRFTTAVTIS